MYMRSLKTEFLWLDTELEVDDNGNQVVFYTYSEMCEENYSDTGSRFVGTEKFIRTIIGIFS